MRKKSCLTLALIMVVMAALSSVGFIQAGAVESASYTFTRCNLYLNMVLNAIYYFPMMYGYLMMFE